MRKKQTDEDKKKTLNVVLGLVLAFLAVLLCVDAVRKVQQAAALSAVVGFCGVVLFGSVGVMLLAGEIRQWLRRDK